MLSLLPASINCLTTAVRTGRYEDPHHVPDEETEAQRGPGTYPRPQVSEWHGQNYSEKKISKSTQKAQSMWFNAETFKLYLNA